MSDGAPRMGYRDRLRARVSRYRPADKDALLAFRRAMYGAASVFCDARYLQWQFEEPPAGRAGRPGLWLYQQDGAIEGQQGALHTELKIGAGLVPAAWTFDLLVSPPLQLRGIGSVLQQVAFEETGLSLGLEVSEQARGPMLKAGWVDAGTAPLFVRPLVPSALLIGRGAQRLLVKAAALADLSLFAVDRLLPLPARLRGMRVETPGSFDERATRLFATASRHYPVIGLRDAAWLNWRFVAFPTPHRYHLLTFHLGEALRGWAVLRTGEKHGARAGFIVDFLCAPEDLVCVLAACLAQLREEGCAAVYCLQTNHRVIRAMRALGFLRRDSGWHLMFRASGLDAEHTRILSDQAAWFLTLGDADVDRPREGTRFPAAGDWRRGP